MMKAVIARATDRTSAAREAIARVERAKQTPEAVRLREEILQACADFERSVGQGDKDYLRALHLVAQQHGASWPRRVLALFRKHERRFRNGSEIDPSRISPTLIPAVDGDESGELFSVTRALWSMPYNKGYGRRLRFVVYDEAHDGVIGVIGLQSPPADLAVRDAKFEYPAGRKLELVNSTMDAYAVGAVPPYSYLLGGKLCAGLIAADPIRQAYWRRYAGEKSQMDKKAIAQPLVAVTTTSAFGRSSQYNRLRYWDRLLAQPIGYTLGYGTLHLEHLYPQICDFLELAGRFTSGGFGNGPKVRWQNITRALVTLDLPSSLLRHGVKREVFLYSFVTRLEDGMAGGGFGAPVRMSVAEFGEYWIDRWALPRTESRPEWCLGDERALIEQRLRSAL